MGGLFLLVSIFQPIDGLPGYKLVTREDYSILFGFAFAFIVGAVVGYFLGGLAGKRIGSSLVNQQTQSKPVNAGGTGISSSDKIIAEIDDCFTEKVFMKTEELLSANQPINNQRIAEYATEEVAKMLREKYHYDRDKIIQLLTQYTSTKK